MAEAKKIKSRYRIAITLIFLKVRNFKIKYFYIWNLYYLKNFTKILCSWVRRGDGCPHQFPPPTWLKTKSFWKIWFELSLGVCLFTCSICKSISFFFFFFFPLWYVCKMYENGNRSWNNLLGRISQKQLKYAPGFHTICCAY